MPILTTVSFKRLSRSVCFSACLLVQTGFFICGGSITASAWENRCRRFKGAGEDDRLGMGDFSGAGGRYTGLSWFKEGKWQKKGQMAGSCWPCLFPACQWHRCGRRWWKAMVVITVRVFPCVGMKGRAGPVGAGNVSVSGAGFRQKAGDRAAVFI